eukprot:gene37-4288_t
MVQLIIYGCSGFFLFVAFVLVGIVARKYFKKYKASQEALKEQQAQENEENDQNAINDEYDDMDTFIAKDSVLKDLKQNPKKDVVDSSKPKLLSNKKPSNHNLFKNVFRNEAIHSKSPSSSSDRDSWASLPPLESPVDYPDEEEEKSETIKEPDFGRKIDPNAILVESTEYTLTEFSENFSFSDDDSEDDSDDEDHPEILMYMNSK